MRASASLPATGIHHLTRHEPLPPTRLGLEDLSRLADLRSSALDVGLQGWGPLWGALAARRPVCLPLRQPGGRDPTRDTTDHSQRTDGPPLSRRHAPPARSGVRGSAPRSSAVSSRAVTLIPIISASIRVRLRHVFQYATGGGKHTRRREEGIQSPREPATPDGRQAAAHPHQISPQRPESVGLRSVLAPRPKRPTSPRRRRSHHRPGRRPTQPAITRHPPAGAATHRPRG